MAYLELAKTEEELKGMRIADIKKSYIKIGTIYNKMIDGDYLKCPKCGEIMRADTAFYMDKNYVTNRYPICKRCLLQMVEQRKTDRDEPNETKESVQKVLQMMDRVYDDTFYEDCIKGAQDGVKEKNRTSPFTTYITATASLPQWKGKTWKDSNFGVGGNVSEQEQETKRVRKEIRKIFGGGFSEQDYSFLQEKYDDFKTRTSVDSISQEVYVQQICLQLLEIDKDRKTGRDVTNKLKALDTLMSSSNLQPKQNVNNAASDSLSYGQLIEKFESERPISDPDPEFKDVNKIGRLIRIYFSGHLAKSLGLKNAYSDEYEEEMKENTVLPLSLREDDKSDVYQDIFGSDES